MTATEGPVGRRKSATRSTRKALVVVAAAATATGLGLRRLFAPGSSARRTLVRGGNRVVRAARYRLGRWNGVSYRLGRRRPDPAVSDNVLADRIRSSLGPLEARLDIPHVHVMVEDHTVLLHGDVATIDDAAAIEDAVHAMSGVVGVESYLHLGLLRSDTRPSEGIRRHPESPALHQLLDAVLGSGIGGAAARQVLRVILATFAERVPAGELDHVRAHLPDDVRRLITPPRRRGAQPTRARAVADLVARMLAADRIPVETAEQAAQAVFAALRSLVPEEAGDVAAYSRRTSATSGRAGPHSCRSDDRP